MAAPIDLHEVAEREHEARSRYPWRIKACGSTACLSAGSAATISAFEQTIETSDLALLDFVGLLHAEHELGV